MAASMRSQAFCRWCLRKYQRREITRFCSSSSKIQSEIPKPTEEKQTHFGYQYIPEEQKEKKVYEVFENVASKYDLMNDAMSTGVHRLWKDSFVKALAPSPGTQLLDMAGGTGDIAFRFLKYIKTQEEKIAAARQGTPEGEVTPMSHVTVADINKEMLKVGEMRAEKRGIKSGISWLQANAENLQFPENTFDAYTIAFGIRNCTHIDKVISEAYRVLKPGGRFMCLEFSRVGNPIIRSLYDLYSFQVIPVLGQVLARDWKSYQYLVESIRQFPDQDTFKRMIQDGGFKAVSFENLTFGVAAIHSGFKI
ncbi:hypothetical protein ScPMuIL_005659 [Solemya velum]